MALAVAATMPQRDRTSVLEKLQARRYPDGGTFRSGLRRFGIKPDAPIKSGIKDLDAGIGKAVKKLKEDHGE
jgi:hypothetical protein